MRSDGPASTDELDEAAREGTLSAAEGAMPAPGGVALPGRVAVFIGEIPAPEDSTTMLWTARCNDPGHDLLGHFSTREDAESAKQEHLETDH
jgi:hypothetical protein